MPASIRKYVYLNPRRDADILEYLARQDSESAAIRHALREHIAGRRVPGLDREALRQVLREELVGLALQAAPIEADDELDELLDDLSDNLLMD